eukprot:SAG31_NODE_24437_length_481_cov_0.942408_1_plen_47_part_01
MDTTFNRVCGCAEGDAELLLMKDALRLFCAKDNCARRASAGRKYGKC